MQQRARQADALALPAGEKLAALAPSENDASSATSAKTSATSA